MVGGPSPEVMVAEQSPVDDIEQDEAGGKEPARDPVDEHRLLPLLLHHVPDLFLSLQLHVVHQVSDALWVYHTVAPRCGRKGSRSGQPRGWGRGRRCAVHVLGPVTAPLADVNVVLADKGSLVMMSIMILGLLLLLV